MSAGRLALPLFLALGLSGCTQLGVDSDADIPSITLPGLRYGDEWTIAFMNEEQQPSGGTVTLRVASEPQTVHNRFGQAVGAVAVQTNYSPDYVWTQWF